MRSLTLRIKNQHNRQSPRLRVVVAEDGLHTDVVRPAADDGKSPIVYVREIQVGGHKLKVELRITPVQTSAP